MNKCLIDSVEPALHNALLALELQSALDVMKDTI